ncbi:hypothetical protein SYNPS1DRAFT_28084 [Syncephalis pseudoplumigaleata]|uniref:Uncharacterized protein n=1 Tax=Syncephalis pseudoplumigaleata TaxID=1712513 RepID=A0A4P9Z2L8_9FUNG|nr:hypothetical protein SYNPS1DRAFT_28084 [Syncephalis pseudoplumigaleata]|eukprot:RKP26212.1 hypothetical protein SYNPS1DRAFT_28084 [Syncephalis pseudoplumigaleata]
MAESSDSFDVFAEVARDRDWSLQDEGARELKRTSGVITPDAKELCTKKYNAYRPEDYSSDEDPAERRSRRRQVLSASASAPPATDTAKMEAVHAIDAQPTTVVDTTTVTTHTHTQSSSSNTATLTAHDIMAPVAISVYDSQRISLASTTAASMAITAAIDNNQRQQHDDDDDADETASCTSSAPTEIVDYEETGAVVSSSPPTASTLERVRHVADTIAAALRPKLYPVFHVRDFAYPEDDPRHKGIYPRPVSAYRSVTNLFSYGDNDSEDGPRTSDASAASSSSTADGGCSTATTTTGDSHKDEYTGPAKAIHDFYAEDPKDVLFRAGEECWIDRQLSQGVLLTFKNGQRCHVRESYLEFTNHE